MSITRIGETQAKPESTEALHNFLLSIMPMIKSSQGCESVTLYQSHDEPTKFTMTEVWDSVESHQASVKNIPPEMLTKIRPLLASARRVEGILSWFRNNESDIVSLYFLLV